MTPLTSSIQDKTLLANILARNDLTLLCNLNNSDLDELIEMTRIQSVQPLLYFLNHQSTSWNGLPEKMRGACEEEYRQQAILEVFRQSELEEILKVMDAKGLPSILLKGTAFALDLYPESGLRPRGDTDLLIRASDRVEVFKIFESLGFENMNMISGEHVNHQAMFSKRDVMGIAHVYDIHWKLCNPHPFSELFSFEEAYEGSKVVSVGSARGRALSWQKALVYACVHLQAHHHHEERLIWFYDIHLLCHGRNLAWFEGIAKLSSEKRVSSVCRKGIQGALNYFKTLIPEGCLEEMFLSESKMASETGVPYLNQPKRRFDVILHDIQSESSWVNRLMIAKEHLFPGVEYMKKKYHIKSSMELPFFYLWRIIVGLPRSLRKFR